MALFALWIYCIFDVIRTEESSIQNLPKMLWLSVVLFVPGIGSIAWLLLGRAPRGSWDLRGPQTRRPPQSSGPSLPDPRMRSKDHEAKREEALRRYMADREEEQRKREEEIRRLEEELRGDEGDQPAV